MKRRTFSFFLLLSFFALGLFRESEQRTRFCDIPFQSLNQRISLEGEVVAVPETSIRGKRRVTTFQLHARILTTTGKKEMVDSRVQVFSFHCDKQIRYGDTVRLYGDISAAKRSLNPGEFDYRAFLLAHQISAVFYTYGTRSVRVLHSSGTRWLTKIQDARLNIASRIRKIFKYPENELIVALWLGFRRNLPTDLQQIYLRSGTIHALSISGLHVSMVGGFFYFLFRWIGFARKLNAVVTLIIVGIYLLIAGASAPVLRSSLMAFLVLFGVMIERDHDIWQIFVAVFLLTLFYDPHALFQVSFQLSYLSVAILILFCSPKLSDVRSKKEKMPMAFMRLDQCIDGVKATVRSSLAISTILLPYFASHFHMSTLLASIPSNILVIPATLFFLISGLIAYVVSCINFQSAVLLGQIISSAHQGVLALLRCIIGIPFTIWHVPEPPWWFHVFYFLGLCAFWSVKRLRQWRSIGYALCVSLYVWAACSTMFPCITFLHTGAGTTIFMRMQNRQPALLRAGRSLSESRMRWIVEPFLMSEGIHRIDYYPIALSRRVAGKEITMLERNFTVHERVSMRDGQKMIHYYQFEGQIGAVRLEHPKLPCLAILRPDAINLLASPETKLTSVDVIFIRWQDSISESAWQNVLEKTNPKTVIIAASKDSDVFTKLKGRGRETFHFLAYDGAKKFAL